MTIRAKQRLAACALLAIATWPLVHRGLVERYNITPWKFMGFAMYCMPKLEPLVDIYAYYGERRSEVDPRRAQMTGLMREVARFVTFRGVWGELLGPDRISEVVLSHLTRADRVQVVVTEGYLDRETWRLAARTRSYDYQAPPHTRLGGTQQARRSQDRVIRRMQKRSARQPEQEAPGGPD